MTRVSRLVFGPLLVFATVLAAPAYSAEPAEPAEPAGTAAPASAERDTSSGRLLGVVTDAAGAPLEEVLISATGPRGATLAVCDAEGRFEFHELAPGMYLLRTHIAGFAALERHVVQVRSDSATVHSVTLRRATSGVPAPAFLAARTTRSSTKRCVSTSSTSTGTVSLWRPVSPTTSSSHGFSKVTASTRRSR